jgi:Prophage tail length tape measure protein
MTIALASLRVSAEMDAAKYVAGANAVVAANKGMTATNQASGASFTQTDQKISQSGDVLARLSRQYVDGYASVQRMNSAVNQLSRVIDSGKISMSEAAPILDGIYRKYGFLADAAQFAAKGQHELAAAITETNARLAAQVAAAAKLTAANQNGFHGGGMHTANIAAQFQDIAVTSAMGMSPMQIALQQGTQLSAVLGEGGAAGAVKMLAAGFVSMINPCRWQRSPSRA